MTPAALILVAPLLFAAPAIVRGATGTIEGVVRAGDGTPVSGATVAVHGTSLSATTDDKGAYLVKDVPSGAELVVTASLAGVVAPPAKVWVVPGRNVVDFVLKPAFSSQLTVDAEIPLLNASDGVSRLTLSPEQIAVLPSLGEQDIFRAFQLLPGVGANETSSGLFVRGGTPDQNLVSYDGFTVYHMDHLFGYFSAFNMDAVAEVQLSKAATEARYGGRLSSVLEITGKSGSTDKKGASIGVSLLSVHALGQLPLGDRASLLVTGRRSFQGPLYDKILDLVRSSGSGSGPTLARPAGSGGGGAFQGGGGPPGGGPLASFDTQPKSSFYDLNGKLLFRPTTRDTLSLTGYRGSDGLDNSRELQLPTNLLAFLEERGIEPPGDLSIADESSWGNTGVGALWSRQWTSRLQSRLSFGYSRFHSLRDQSTSAGNSGRAGLAEDNALEDATARLEIPLRLGRHELEIGGQVTSNDVRYAYDTGSAPAASDQGDGGLDPARLPPLVAVLDRSETGTQLSAYVQDRTTLFGRLTLTPGLRFTRFDRTASQYLEPRVSGSLQLVPGLRLKGAWGRNHQFANRIVREDVLGGNREFWALADGETVAVAEATHLVGGFGYDTKGFVLQVEAFRNEQRGLTQFAPRFTPRESAEGIDFNQFFYRGEGTARGLELLVQRKIGRNTGWLSYTLSKAEQSFPELEPEPFAADHDQRHELKAVDSFRLGPWTFSGTWILATGRPYTEPTGVEELQLPNDGPTIERVVVGAKNGARLPAYHRLDLAVHYAFELGPTKGTLGLTAFNVYDRRNVWYKEFRSVSGEIVENSINLMGRTINAYASIRF